MSDNIHLLILNGKKNNLSRFQVLNEMINIDIDIDSPVVQLGLEHPFRLSFQLVLAYPEMIGIGRNKCYHSRNLDESEKPLKRSPVHLVKNRDGDFS